MIYINVSLYWPNWWNRFNSLSTWSGATPIPHKYWEVQIVKHRNLLKFEFGWTVCEDHAGLNLELGLLGYEISFMVYDHRHWDTITNTWRQYD